jgi:hypothetical protein
MYDQLYNYLTKFELLSNSQFGFRVFQSTATALLDCTNDCNIYIYEYRHTHQVNLKYIYTLSQYFTTKSLASAETEGNSLLS